MNSEPVSQAYVDALNKVGVGGVKRLELSIRMKIEQRTAGGPMALRKAFKFFDTDASGDIDPDEFYAAMHAFGLEFTEDQVILDGPLQLLICCHKPGVGILTLCSCMPCAAWMFCWLPDCPALDGPFQVHPRP